MRASAHFHVATKGQSFVYPAENWNSEIEFIIKDETVWLNQQHVADLFLNIEQSMNLHLHNFFEKVELKRAATHKKSLSVRQGGNCQVKWSLVFYNLDAMAKVESRRKEMNGESCVYPSRGMETTSAAIAAKSQGD